MQPKTITSTFGGEDESRRSREAIVKALAEQHAREIAEMRAKEAADRAAEVAARVCASCGESVALLAGSGTQSLVPFILDRHPLLRACKSTYMHRLCFRKWEHRRLYVRLFNEYSEGEGSEHAKRVKQSGAK